MSDKSVIVKEGSEVNLKCFLNDTLEALGCSFVSPSPASKNYNMLQVLFLMLLGFVVRWLRDNELV